MLGRKKPDDTTIKKKKKKANWSYGNDILLHHILVKLIKKLFSGFASSHTERNNSFKGIRMIMALNDAKLTGVLVQSSTSDVKAEKFDTTC